MAEERRYPSSRQSKGGFIFQVAAGHQSLARISSLVGPHAPLPPQ